MKIGCVIMASGLSRRFGGNKLLAPFQGEAMLIRTVNTVRQVCPENLVAVTRSGEAAALCRQANVSAVLHDLPLRSDTVRLGTAWLLEQTPDLEGIFYAAADQPRLSSASLKNLCHAFAQDPSRICRLRWQDRPGNPVLFPRDLFPELMDLPPGKGGAALVRKYPERVRYVDVPEEAELMDADTPQDLATLETL